MWKPEPWMKPYLKHICNTGGNSIPEMMEYQIPLQINGPRALLAACVKSQVTLLGRLHKAGILGKEGI